LKKEEERTGPEEAEETEEVETAEGGGTEKEERE